MQHDSVRPAVARATPRSRPNSAPSRGRRGPAAIFATVFVWLLVLVMIIPDGFNFSPAAHVQTEGSAVVQAIWLTLLGIGVVVPLRSFAATRRLLGRVNPFILVFVALAMASVLWSIDPATTVRRDFRALIMLLDGLAFVLLAGRATTFQSVIRTILTLVLIGSVVFVIVSPELAVEQSTAIELKDAWRGLTSQKNALGSLAAIALVLWFHALLSKEEGLVVSLAGMALSALCMINSRSSTSIMGAAFSMPLMFMMMRPMPALRRLMPYLVVLFAGLLLTYSLAVLNLMPGSYTLLEPITAITGKTQTFSGRTAIWEIMNEQIAQRPLLGSGYGAYWLDVPGSPSQQMIARLYFWPTEAHNGYLDVINDLGLVGGLCLFGYLIVYLRQGLLLLAAARPMGALFLTLMFEQLIANLSESRWFNVRCCEFPIMTLATFAMARTVLEVRAQRKQLAEPHAPPVAAAAAPPAMPAAPETTRRFAAPRRPPRLGPRPRATRP